MQTQVKFVTPLHAGLYVKRSDHVEQQRTESLVVFDAATTRSTGQLSV